MRPAQMATYSLPQGSRSAQGAHPALTTGDVTNAVARFGLPDQAGVSAGRQSLGGRVGSAIRSSSSAPLFRTLFTARLTDQRCRISSPAGRAGQGIPLSLA